MKKTPELFDAWNEKKKQIEFSPFDKKDIKVGEFWWYYVGVHVGNEMSKDGKFLRVGLVLKNDAGNGLVLIAPLTTQHKPRMKQYYEPVNLPPKYRIKESNIVLNQINFIDRKRFLIPTASYRPLCGFARKVLYLFVQLLIKKCH